MEIDEAAPYAKGGKPGGGPRHVTLHPSKRFAYGIEEMGSRITVYNYAEGRLSGNAGEAYVQTISTIPEGWEGVREICKTVKYNHCADIHISPDGRFAYGSNRGHESIAIF